MLGKQYYEYEQGAAVVTLEGGIRMIRSRELSPSLEDYLEVIYHQVREKQVARARDIGERLEVEGSSVTGALRALKEKGLVHYAPYDVITLTPEGEKAAKEVVRRHEVLRDFFVRVLGVEPAAAEEGACRVEHAMPPAILEKFVSFTEFLEVCPRVGGQWLHEFRHFCVQGQNSANCPQCIGLCLDRERTKRAGKKEGGRIVSLRALQPGQKGRIVKVRGQGDFRKRIVDMGVTAGTPVEMRGAAPMGDPLEVKIKGYHLALRCAEADKITVELI